MQDLKIDLHMHTNNSDGSQSVKEILEELKGKGADIVSITDHDTVKGYYQIKQNKNIVPKGLTVVYGIEITCNFNNNPRDMLGYGIDIDVLDNYFKNKHQKDYMINKEQKILNQLKTNCVNYGFVVSDNLKVINGDKSEGFKAVYFDLIKNKNNLKLCPDLNDMSYFYWQYVANQKSPLFVCESYDMPTFKEACDLIHKANGLAFLAHPYCYKMTDEETNTLVKEAVKGGIDGIELYHSTHLKEEREKIKELANKYNLFTSGGSDYHGINKPKIKSLTGTDNNVNVSYSVIKPWIDKVNKIVG